jgi:dihydrosphingosine 1-phosphate phosphatase
MAFFDEQATNIRSYRFVPPIPDQPLPSFRDIPELLARFSRPRSVSVGPQSEIDVWEQIDYRDERRRQRSNSVESNMSNREARHRLNSIGEKPFADDDILFDDEGDEKLLRTKIEEPRKRYDVEVVTKLIVYTGISLQ